MCRSCTFFPWPYYKQELLCHYSDLAGNYHSQVGWLCCSVYLVPGRSKNCIVTAVNWKETLSVSASVCVCVCVGLSGLRGVLLSVHRAVLIENVLLCHRH